MTVRLLADHNFNEKILLGLRQRLPAVDVMHQRDMEMEAASDPDVLAWAASQGRVVLTHDIKTMKDFAYERLGRGEAMAGLLVVSQTASVGEVIADLAMIVECSDAAEWQGMVAHVPMR